MALFHTQENESRAISAFEILCEAAALYLVSTRHGIVADKVVRKFVQRFTQQEDHNATTDS